MTDSIPDHAVNVYLKIARVEKDKIIVVLPRGEIILTRGDGHYDFFDNILKDYE